jgi:hypothetical protein
MFKKGSSLLFVGAWPFPARQRAGYPSEPHASASAVLTPEDSRDVLVRVCNRWSHHHGCHWATA